MIIISEFINSPPFLTPKILLPFSQKPDAGPYADINDPSQLCNAPVLKNSY
jgi:hypothetical protein